MAPDHSERRLAAIMFTDIVGYTALMAESEVKGLAARERHRAVLGPLAERFAGQIVDENGDELVLSFPSALNAVHCALAAQRELHNDAELQLRIGIHQGDVIFEQGRIYGDGVNVASRIRPLAEPGGICVSDEIQRSIRNQEDIDAVPLGPQELKNVAQPIEVFAVGWPGAVSAPMPASPTPRLKRFLAALALAALFALGVWGWNRTVLAPRPTKPIRSIAVLPLENLSGDPEQEYFADGMTEVLIGDLAKIGALSVISRTSVMRYKHSDKSLPEIAEELNVDTILEGTVMRVGDRVRITAQLIDARNDMHVWADRYERELRDVLALQSEVARAVASQVRQELTPKEEAALTASRRVDPQAYDAYLRGLQLRGPMHEVQEWGPRAIGQFERAIELDPEFAGAYTSKAQVHTLLGVIGFDRRFRAELPKAREAAQRALELDDRVGAAHAVLADTQLYIDWDFSSAGREYERALQLSPSDSYVLNVNAWYLLMVGDRTDEALDLSERLLHVAPFDLYYRAGRFNHMWWARQFDRAVEELERVQRLDPSWVDGRAANIYYLADRPEEAHRASLASLERCGSVCDPIRKAAELGWAESGYAGATRATLEILANVEGFSPFLIASNYVVIGEMDEALAWLERGYAEHEPRMLFLRGNPNFDPLRSDPRFQDLLRRIGFPES